MIGFLCFHVDFQMNNFEINWMLNVDRPAFYQILIKTKKFILAKIFLLGANGQNYADNPVK